MPAPPPFTYDAASATLRWSVPAAGDWSIETARSLSGALRAGTWSGQPVRHAVVDFGDEAVAAVQGAAAQFLGLTVLVAGRARDGEVPRFTVRDDFDID